jgi:carbohydrate kinase (thermoresistant glucokinase family)
MRAGVPLTEADRRPFLEGIARWIDDHLATGTPGVVTCSALKRAYRDEFRRPGVHMIHLHGDPDLIAERMAGRKGHFFPAKLLESQIRELEPPGADEPDVVTVSIAGTPEDTVRQIVDALPLPAAHRG